MWRYWMAAVAAAFAPFSAPALAQAQSPENYPSKTVTLVVPYAAGGSTDIISRLVASELQTRWGQTVIVENKPGASGFIGARTVAQAAPDGHTLMMGIAGLLTATLVADPSPFDLTRDFTPVLQAGRVPAVFAVPLNSRFTSMPDLIRHLKAGNADLSIGNWGTGSVPHIQAALLAASVKAVGT